MPIEISPNASAATQGYDPMVDARFPGIKRIVWGFPTQNTAGVGPVVDVTSPEITCRKDALPPALSAQARAGSQISMQWSPWFTSHKGPVITYMGELKDGMKPQDVDFFKINEVAYDPKTGVWGSDQLINQNNTWNLQIPSDVKPGKYIFRHEILALHFAGSGNPNGAGTANSGTQFYPTCFNVDVTSSGTAAPAGVKFPGGYKPSDPGILMNLYFGPNSYTSPGPAVYQGKFDAPAGPKPVVKETGAFAGAQEGIYQGIVTSADGILNSIVSGMNQVLPGGGGFKWNAGNGALSAPPNGGKSSAPVGNIMKGGLLPWGVTPSFGAPKAPAQGAAASTQRFSLSELLKVLLAKAPANGARPAVAPPAA